MALRSLQARQQRTGSYPFQWKGLVLGLYLGLLGGILFWSPIVGFAWFVLIFGVCALWRTDEPPILSFVVGFQWIQIASGYMYGQVTGTYPFRYPLGDVHTAVLLSLFGLLFLIGGIRLGLRLLQQRWQNAERDLLNQEGQEHYNLRLLFWIVILLFTINYLSLLNTKIFFVFDQILSNILSVRFVLLLLLWYAVLKQREGYRYAMVSFLVALFPTFTSYFAKFMKRLLVMVLLVLMSGHKAGREYLNYRRQQKALKIALVSLLIGGLFLLGGLWSAGVQTKVRHLIDTGQVADKPLPRIGAFLESSITTLPAFVLSPGKHLYTLMQRLWYVGFFSNVLEQVPSYVSHTRGKLTALTLEMLKPRFLFPGKRIFGSDSWLVYRYAGIPVAGAERGTSIGIGYMGDFYIDFGVPGMFIPIFLFGLLLGLMYAITLINSPSWGLFTGVAIVIFLNVNQYETFFPKMFGAVVETFLVFNVLLRFLGPWLHSKLSQ